MESRAGTLIFEEQELEQTPFTSAVMVRGISVFKISKYMSSYQHPPAVGTYRKKPFKAVSGKRNKAIVIR